MHRWIVLALFVPSLALAETPVERLAWLPADTHSVAGSPAARSPMLVATRSLLGDRLPACVDEQLAALDGVYLIWRSPGDPAATLVHGRVARDPIERCLGRVLREIGVGAITRAEGALSELTLRDGQTAWLGWSESWIVWNDRRDRVEALLAAAKAPRARTPLAALLRRVDATQLWAVSDLDYTRAFVGVPSRGLIVAVRDDRTVPATIVFASDKDAARAAAAIAERAKSGALEAPLARALSGLRPQRRGRELSLDLAAFADPTVMEAAQRALDAAQRAPQK